MDPEVENHQNAAETNPNNDAANEKPIVKPPVIMHSTFQNSNIATLLQKDHKVRFSDNIITGTCIYPMAGVAFMLLPLSETLDTWPPHSDANLREDLIQVIDKFLQMHQICFLIATAKLHGDNELKAFNILQQKYLSSKLTLIPSHHERESSDIMRTITKVNSKPLNDVLFKRVESILEDSVTHASDTLLDDILQVINLQSFERNVLQDGLGNLADIANASKEDLTDCCLDSEMAKKLMDHFENNSLIN